jgi:DNA helicase II / ATP-dependent DNA helicase PcrA
MSKDILLNQAEQAAKEALDRIYVCIEKRKSFRLEAGAGAGKTYSLIKALKYLIEKQGAELLRRHQQVACITYTNVATEEIQSRTDRHPLIMSATIHAFCWSMIKDFQPYLRDHLPTLGKWSEKLEETGGIGTRRIDYELGYQTVKEDCISLGHDDVLSLMVLLMEKSKFRNLFTMRYPFLFVDEYQDTHKEFANALKTHFLNNEEGPLIGFFGDHWQKIYGTGCGEIEHLNLEFIPKAANFRSVMSVVDGLNRMRPDLQQAVKDQTDEGSVTVYHTNGWNGERRTESHWKGDLPVDIAHKEVGFLREYLTCDGWDFSPDKTKILMLTHNVLAAEQGYSSLSTVFSRTEAFIKKEDKHVAFFVDTLEPACIAYEDRSFGTMFAALGGRTHVIQSHADKKKWSEDMDRLLELRQTATIGEVLDHLLKTKRLKLTDAIERKERDLIHLTPEEIAKSSSLQRLGKLRQVSYQEIIALSQFLNEHTPFATKHGVKGAEFENVLVVFGRGWNQYNFNQMLEWVETGVPQNKQDTFGRNRNLFYVVCSRPKKRLALLFTQELSEDALATLTKWFGASAIHSM